MLKNISIKDKETNKFHILETEDLIKFKRYNKETISNIKIDNNCNFWIDGSCIGKDINNAIKFGITNIEIIKE